MCYDYLIFDAECIFLQFGLTLIKLCRIISYTMELYALYERNYENLKETRKKCPSTLKIRC